MESFGRSSIPGAPTTNFEQLADLFGENSFAAHASPECRVIQFFSAAQMPDAAEHLLFPIGEMFVEPMLEERRHRPRQTHDRVAGKLRAGFAQLLPESPALRDRLVRE